MITELPEFFDALQGSGLEGLPTERHELEGGDVVFAMDLTGHHDPLDAQANRDLWTATRPFIDQIGLYPVRANDAPLPAYGGKGFYGGGNYVPRHALDAQSTISLDEAQAALRTPQLHWVDPDWGEARATTVARVGVAPTFEELSELTPVDDRTVERHLMRWETERGWSIEKDTRDAYDRGGRFDWNEYEERAWLHWLPTKLPEETAAFLSYYGGGDYLPEQLRFITMLRSWRQRFGAVVTAWGSVTLSLWIEHPPQDLEAAFDFAYELERFTRTDMWLRDFARALVGRQEIQLFQRP